jgi:DNA-binding PadR family transcriptional regulator
VSIKITTTVAKTLAAFLAASDVPQYGMSLIKQTGLAPGTLYPILKRLHKEGWLNVSNEDIDPAIEGRPARKNYLLSETGRRESREALTELWEAVEGALSTLDQGEVGP